MPVSIPVSRTKSAALSRVLDLVPKGYLFYTAGEVPIQKLERLITKFHERYGIACTPAQRVTRKQKGLANALLVLYWPADLEPDSAPEERVVGWLLLVTNGGGAVQREEPLKSVVDDRLRWLGYELVRHPVRGRSSWTWRRPKEAMAELYALLAEQLNRRRHEDVADTLARIARQPGFAGVREQSWRLCEFARQRGYAGELPHLFFMQKVSHGERLVV